jgi:acylphosphatase
LEGATAPGCHPDLGGRGSRTRRLRQTGVVIRRRVVVTGRVQGVFFRDSCEREANRLGVRGWALNREDGRVEAVFEGEPDAVEEVIEWARTGPAHAYVTNIEVVDEQPAGESGFQIR